MSDMRFNAVTGDWVIIAPERASRPHKTLVRSIRPPAPSSPEACPFCPGNEASTGTARLVLPRDGSPWGVRCVDNKFSALAPLGSVERRGQPLRMSMSGVGLHEVLIETPEHGLVTSRRTEADLAPLIDAYHHRFLAFYADPRIKQVVIFKNHGVGAGISLDHPHSQIVGTPVIPAQIRERMVEALRHESDTGRCLFCAILQLERDEGVRVVAANDSFVAFIPYAALSPFHIWFFPTTHRACFGSTTQAERRDLAAILLEVLRLLDSHLGDPDYNYVIRSLGPSEAAVGYFHWYLALVPRVSRSAGFEIGTGMHINPSSPEASAAFLRGDPP